MGIYDDLDALESNLKKSFHIIHDFTFLLACLLHISAMFYEKKKLHLAYIIPL